MFKLKEILINIFNELESNKEDGYSSCTSLKEQIELETYSMLSELRLNLDNHYKYVASKIRGMFVFTDNNEIEHFIRLIFEHGRWEVKVGFFQRGTSSPIYDRPNIYYNLDYDERIFNTQLKILIDEIIPYFFESKLVDENEKKLFFPAIDIPRYRLYRIALSKFLDRSKYKLELFPSEKTMVLTKIRIT
jgi:hypothetical protein